MKSVFSLMLIMVFALSMTPLVIAEGEETIVAQEELTGVDAAITDETAVAQEELTGVDAAITEGGEALAEAEGTEEATVEAIAEGEGTEVLPEVVGTLSAEGIEAAAEGTEVAQEAIK